MAYAQGSYTEELQDSDLVDLSHKITSEKELLEVGVKALKLPDFIIKTAVYNHKDINSAAHDVFSSWRKQLTNDLEAYVTLKASLRNQGFNRLATTLNRKPTTTSAVLTLPQERLNQIQLLLRQSMRNKPFCLADGLDWTLHPRTPGPPIKQIHTKLSLTRKNRNQISTEREYIQDITQIFNEENLEENGPVRILLQAPGGNGKSTALKNLAIGWADKTEDKLKRFHFTFHISLNRVKDNSSIENIIIAQHSGLKAKHVKPEEIKSILEGDSNQVLLLIDGYDEYKTRRNTDIDKAIKKEKLWNCWMILTSRETDDVKMIKEYMDIEIDIHGFSNENVVKYIKKSVGNQERAQQLLKEIVNYDLCLSDGYGGVNFESSLLAVPILLKMICTLFVRHKTLPKTRTTILQEIVDRCMDREAIREKGEKALESAMRSLQNLGKLAWNGLHRRKYSFEKREVTEVAGDEALTLGLLFGMEDLEPHEETTDLYCFLHLIFQEFAAAKYISKLPKAYLQRLFPSWNHILFYQTVIEFAVGLSDNPFVLLELIYDRLSDYLKKTVCLTKEHINTLKYLHRELNGKKPFGVFNNRYINFVTKDNPVITIPSRFYYFEDVSLFQADGSFLNCKDIKYTTLPLDLAQPVPTSECLINASTQGLAEILKILQKIQKYQQVYVSVFNVSCHTKSPYTSPESHKETMSLLVSEVKLNQATRVVAAVGCYLTQPAFNHIAQQLEGCKQLHTLVLKEFGPKPTIGVLPMNVERTFFNMETLRFLNLENSGISRHSSISLMAGLSNCVNLVQLNLSNNGLTYSVAGLFSSCGFHYLEEFALISTELSKQDIKAISIAVQEGKLPLLNVLDLSLNNLTECMEDFISIEGDSGTFYPSLKLLSLHGTGLNRKDIGNLSQGLMQHRFSALHSLDIGSNNLSGDIGKLLQGAFGIKNLYLANTNLGRNDLKDLSSNLNASCVELDLSGNKLTGIVGELFTEMKSIPVRILNLVGTHINNKDVMNLSNAVKAGKIPKLNQLLLNGNELHNMENAVYDLVKSCVEHFRHQKVNIRISLDGLENPKAFGNKLDSVCQESPVSISCTQVVSGDGDSLIVRYSRTIEILARPGLNIIPPPDDAPEPAHNIVFYLKVVTDENET